MKKNLQLTGIASVLYIIGMSSAYTQTIGQPLVELSLDENFGITAFDSSGNGNNAVLHNAIWVEGKEGSALAFDGIDDYAELTNEKTTQLYNFHKQNHTIAAWVKPTEALGFRSGVITRWGVHQGLFYNANQTFTFKHRTPSGTQSVTTGESYPPGEFYHVSTTINGDTGELILYINGQQVGIKRYISGEHSTQKLFRPWRLGVKNIDATTQLKRENFSGVIDEVLFFDRALTAEEISEQWGQPQETVMCTLGENSGTGTGESSSVLEPGDNKSETFISFEQSSVPSEWTTDKGILAINNQQAKHGDSALQWTWSDGAVLQVDDLAGQGLDSNIIDKTNYTQSSFRLWLHNDEAVANDPLRIEFYDEQGNLQYHYYVNLDFTGWRAATVRYRADMFGDKSSQELVSMKIHAPANTCSGQLLIDLVDFTAHKGLVTGGDHQVPMAATGYSNHWTDMLRFEAYAQPSVVTPSAQQLADADAMKVAYRTEELLKGASTKGLDKAITQYNELGISIEDAKVLAEQPLFGPYHAEFGVKIGVVDGIILTLVLDYLDNDNLSSHDRFINLVRYMLEQGFAAGSLLENSSHIGYSTRSITNAILLMETELKAQGLWQQAFDMLAWYNTLEQVWQPVSENVSNSDHARTRIPAILGVILHIDDDVQRIHYLNGYKAHIETWLTSYNRGENGIKPDFSSFHHHTQYPGYVYGALGSISTAVRYLSNSAFSISDEKFDFIRKMALSYAVQHAGKDMPLSMSGRNPFKNPSVSGSLLQLGKASSSEAQQAIFYGAYNRLFQANGTTNGVGAEVNPSGFWQFNYRPVGVYRQQDWVANIKGLNKYFWGSEIYTKDNRFGRYQSYGAVSIYYQPEDGKKNQVNWNGITEAGWNWNKMPGTTTKYLSWSELLAEKTRQDEWAQGTFAGALRFGAKTDYYVEQSVEGECGLYGLDFQQKGSLSSTHEDDFTFKKSVFACNGMLVSLGSNINSFDNQNTIATNLFQQSTTDARQKLVENAATKPNTEYSTTLASGVNWLIDPNGTGYYINSSDQIVINSGKQSSPISTKNGTSFSEGEFATAWIDHKPAPVDASYQYVILPNATKGSMAAFSGRMNAEHYQPYAVLQQNSDAHIIRFDNNLEGFVLFNASSGFAGSFIEATDTPLLVMAKRSNDKLALSLANPDHNFVGKAPRWQDNQEMSVTLTLKGKWQLDELTDDITNITLVADNTVITINTNNGQAYDLKLTAIDEIILGDLDGDSDVGAMDIRALNFALRSGESLDPVYDFNNDGTVDRRDKRELTKRCTYHRCGVK